MTTAPPMINFADLEFNPYGKGGPFAADLARIGQALGTNKIGCSMVVLQPGKRAWPVHEHYGWEELFIILGGEGVIRYAEGTFPVRAGDCIFTPPGKGTAHQLVNTSAAELRYLAISTLESPELCYYPDSGKYGAYASVGDSERLAVIVAESDTRDYWDGES